MKKLMSLLLALMFISFNGAYATEQVSEHIYQPKKVAKKAPTNLVFKTESQTKVLEYNVIQATFAHDFSSKTANVGDEVSFLLNDGLRTVEGTTLLPAGTVLSAQVIGIQKPKSFNRSGKVTLQFRYFETPDGTQYPIKAKLFNKDFLSRGKLNALGKGLSTTLAGTAIGIGAGCGIGAAAGAVIIGGFAIGLPIGLTVGAVVGYMTPGLHYKAKAGDKIVIQLTDNLEFEE